VDKKQEKDFFDNEFMERSILVVVVDAFGRKDKCLHISVSIPLKIIIFK